MESQAAVALEPLASSASASMVEALALPAWEGPLAFASKVGALAPLALAPGAACVEASASASREEARAPLALAPFASASMEGALVPQAAEALASAVASSEASVASKASLAVALEPLASDSFCFSFASMEEVQALEAPLASLACFAGAFASREGALAPLAS